MILHIVKDYFLKKLLFILDQYVISVYSIRMNEYKIIPKKLIVLPEGDPVFSDQATTIEIVDEAAGAFVEVEQLGDNASGKIRITSEEWPKIKKAINKMISICDRLNKEENERNENT